MERRRFLQLLSVGAGALVLPGWLSRALAQDHVDAGAAPPSTLTLATLAGAFRDAQRAGKPLLVIVVPEPATGDAAGYGGDGLGAAPATLVEAIVGGDADAMAELALVHVVCARLPHLRLLVPGTPAGAPELVLVETDALPAHAVAVTPVFPAPPVQQRRVGDDGIEHEIDARVGALTAALHAALVPDRAALERRATVTRAHLDPATLSRIDAQLAQHHAPDAALVDRGAAIVALAADGAPAPVRAALRTALVHAAVARLREHEVPGSVWGTDTGCGPCGMGYTSPRDARFLHFFAQPGYTRGF